MTTWTRFTAAAILAALAGASHAQFYKIKTVDGISWFESPSLGRMWSLAADCTDLGARGTADNPAYNAKALFPDEKSWVVDTLAKYKAWGLNSLGGWSDADVFKKYSPAGQRISHFTVLHLGSYNKAPWDDMFSPTCEKNLEAAAKTLIPPEKNDPYLVGYFTDNELGWWNDALFKTYFAMPRYALGKMRLVKVLQDHYGSDFTKLQADWTTGASSFEALANETKLYLKPGKCGMAAVIEFNTVLAERYYSMVYKIIKKEDPGHLILGDRYCQFYNLETVKASKPYIDVVSTNAGAAWLDGTYPHFYFDTLHELTGKPTIVTEFYFAARENRTGNRNSGEIFPTVQTQAERAAGFANCIKAFASLPYMLGAHWFQFYDEPPKGRGDGEDYNQGLVDVQGVPYEGMVKALVDSHPAEVHASAKPHVSTGIPKAPADPMKDHMLKWDRENGFIPSQTKEAFGDLYACYEPGFLYVGVMPMEYIDETLYEVGKLPEADRPLFDLTIGSWHAAVRFNGEKQKANCTDLTVELAERPGLEHIVVMKIPVKALGLSGLQAGDKLPLKATLFTHARGYKMTWNTSMTLN